MAIESIKKIRLINILDEFSFIIFNMNINPLFMVIQHIINKIMNKY